jgi:short-subunit dehydrogenase
MKNKIVLLTGANGGLGKAFIQELLKLQPKKLYCAARDVALLDDIKNSCDCIEVVQLDISDKNSIEKLNTAIAKLDILINNAGVNTNQQLFEPSFLEIEINLKGTMNLTHALLNKLQHKEAKIINISSITALVNLPIMADYSISKSALHSFTQALRAELANYQAKVYEVLPGPIDTRLTAGAAMPKAKPEDIAKNVLQAVENDVFEIYPDEFSQMIHQRLQNEPQKVVEEFAMSVLKK